MTRVVTYMFQLLLAILCTASGLAQDTMLVSESSIAVSTELAKARDRLDYSDDIIEKQEEEEEKEVKPDRSNTDFNFSDIAGLLLIIFLIGVVFLILYFMLGRAHVFKPKSKKIKELNLQAIEQIEENLEAHDVVDYLAQAEAAKQYRIAIRLHYLVIIKALSSKKLIQWKRDKTNRNYILETSAYAFSDSFREATSIFEKVWYGERDVAEEDFKMIQSQFDALSNKINDQGV